MADEPREDGGATCSVPDQPAGEPDARARTQRALLLFETTIQGIVFQDEGGRIVDANPAAERTLGLPLAQMQGRTSVDPRWRALREDGSDFPGESHPAMVALRTGRPVRDVVMGLFDPSTRTHRWLRVDAVPRGRPGEERPFEVYTTFEDVTERRAAAQALRASEVQFRGLFEESAVGTVIIDPDLRFVRANPAFTRFIGYTEEELRGRSVLDVTHPDHAADDARSVAGLVAGERDGFRTEKRYVRKDGTVVWGALGVTAVRDADGRLLHNVAVVEDIDEQRRTQAALQSLNAELEERVRLRTAELQAANRDLESFSYSVSHDLRAPLRAIDGFCEILAEEHAAALDAEGHRLLGVVRESTARMARLINDRLAFARIGRTGIQRSRVAMGDLARSAWAELARDAPLGRAELVLGDLPDVDGDPSLLLQVFTNLLGNAVKYSSRVAQPRVVVEAAAADGVVTFSVTDNGTGFDMADAGRLFRPFERLHSPRDYPGTGIGLALVHRIVERHGGQVGAHGAPGAGATFTFTLPVGGAPVR